jgi:hypothetical protein
MELIRTAASAMRATIALLLLGLLATTAFADSQDAGGEALSGAEIRALIGGNTVAGSMADGQDYAEFYAEDGTIHGDGYTGSWSIDGDRVCFDYGDGATCYGVTADGRSVTWMLDGEADGTGTVRDGNPMDFGG